MKQSKSRAYGYGSMLALVLLVVSCAETPPHPEPVTLQVWTTENAQATLDVMEEIGQQMASGDELITAVEVRSLLWSELHVELQKAFKAGTLPAVTHLEPFFMSFYVANDLVLPVDDLIEKLGGKERIHSIVRDTTYFNGRFWGIPQHYSIAHVVTRKNLVDAAGSKLPETWEEMLGFLSELADSDSKRAGLYFPGGSKFAVDAMFFMALGSNGGRAFTADGQPDLDSPKVHETLEYLKKFVEQAPPADWQSAGLPQMFPQLIQGGVAVLPLVPPRGTMFFDQNWTEESVRETGLKAPEEFIVLDPPVGPSGEHSVALLDCEPFVVINQDKNNGTTDSQGQLIEDAGKKYLELLYANENYSKLTASVPIQLQPIFVDMEEDYAKLESVERWGTWYEQSVRFVREGRVSPFFTTHPDEIAIPYLYLLYSENIITDMVLKTVTGEASPAEAASEAQQRALKVAKDN